MLSFNEEELKDIELIYRTFCSDGRILTNLELSIMKKLKSMVENYCEDKWKMNNQLKCNKCGVKVA